MKLFASCRIRTRFFTDLTDVFLVSQDIIYIYFKYKGFAFLHRDLDFFVESGIITAGVSIFQVVVVRFGKELFLVLNFMLLSLYVEFLI